MNHILECEREVKELQKLDVSLYSYWVRIFNTKFVKVSEDDINFYFEKEKPPSNLTPGDYEIHPNLIDNFNIPSVKAPRSFRRDTSNYEEPEVSYYDDYEVPKGIRKTGNFFADMYGLTAPVIFEKFIERRKAEIERDNEVISHLYYLPDPDRISEAIHEKIEQILKDTAMKLL